MVNLLKDLIDIPSVSGNEAEIGRYLLRLFQEKGYKTKVQPVREENFNVLAMPSDKVKLLFCTHMDTVAPFAPFSMQEDAVLGRGSCDAKGQIVAMLLALEQLRAEDIHDVGLLVVVEEESTSMGARTAAQLDVGSEYVIVGEPTENKLAIGQKGVYAFTLTAFGTGGHSSMPDKGESAVHKLIKIASEWINSDWGEDPVLGKSLVNFGTFHGGVGMNVLAPEACTDGIFRVATSLHEIRRKISESLTDDITIEIKSESEPQHMISIPDFETTIVGFGSDAAHLRPLGEIVMYGAGSISVAHRESERITLAELERAVHDYARIAKYLLQK